ncbi:hypothetical protein ACCO45_008054 [Purpureocillium lilacinum]|uniref:Uncharacterized protein n=1 Tax=Purpureocillium lilacinum TaxID=33203 RepID=A0ACC4DPV5_PURLI
MPKTPTTRSRPPQSLPAIRRQTSTFGTSSAPLPQKPRRVRLRRAPGPHRSPHAPRQGTPIPLSGPRERDCCRRRTTAVATAPDDCDLRPATCDRGVSGGSQA